MTAPLLYKPPTGDPNQYCDRCGIQAPTRDGMCGDCTEVENPGLLTWAPGWWLTYPYIIARQIEAHQRATHHRPKVARCRICGDWKPIKGQCPTCQTHRKQRT